MNPRVLIVTVIVVVLVFGAMVGFGVVKTEQPGRDPKTGSWADIVKIFFSEPEIAAGDLVDGPMAAGCTRQGQLLLTPAGGACALRVAPSDQQTRKLKLTALVGMRVSVLFDPVPTRDKRPQLARKFELVQGKAAELRVFSEGGTLSLSCQAFPGAPACTVRIGS